MALSGNLKYNSIVKFVVKHKIELLILLILIAAYFILRLPNLTLQPIFADEAIYIRWAQVMRAEPTLRFLPLTDGKTPLFMWAMIPFLKFIHDPLFAGRFLSVLSGVFTLLGIYFLSKKVFGKHTAFWAGLLYVITPYTVFFDRMALVDSMLTSFTVWITYFAILLSKTLRLDIAMFLGYLLGGAVLTKTSGMINFLLLPASILCFNFEKTKKKPFLKLVLLWGVAIFIGLVMYNLLRLGPEFNQLSSRNQDYLFSPQELIGRPLDPFMPHFNDIFDWFPKLLTWPILFCSSVGLFYILYSFHKLGFIILLWGTVPLILEMAFLKTFTARYLLPTIPTLLIIGGYGIIHILPRFVSHKPLSFILMLVVVLPLPLYFNYRLLKDPAIAPLPKNERRGYLEDWTAGYGFSEIAQFLLEKNTNQKVVVGTEGFFGTLPDGLYIYLDKSNIAVVGSHATISAQIRNAAKENLTYFVGNKNKLKGSIGNVVLIKEYPKAKPTDGSEQDSTILYQVLP